MMTGDNDNFVEPESESDVSIILSNPDRVAYDELVDNFGEELIQADIQEVVKERVRSLYDSQDEIRQRISQAQKSAGSQL